MRNKLFSALLFVFLFPALAVAEFKVATVDVAKLMNESKDALEKRKEIEKKTGDMQKKFEEKRDKLKNTEEKIKSGSLAEDSKQAVEFKSAAREFSREFEEARTDLQNEVMKFNKVTGEKVLKAISEYARSNKIDLVLDKGDKTRGPVLFGESSFDITDEVMERLN